MPMKDSSLETRLDWLHAPEPWVVFLVIVPAMLVFAWWLYQREAAKLDPWKQWLLIGLRAGCLLTIICFLFEPILIRERVQTENSTILVLIDDSFSMGIADRYSNAEVVDKISNMMGRPYGEGSTRLDQVQGILANEQLAFLSRLRKKGNVRLATFSGDVQLVADLPRLKDDLAKDTAPSIEEILKKLQLRGKVTRLGDGLYDAINELRGETVSAVVLLSDGRDNGGILKPEEAAERLARRDVQIFTVGIGNSEEPKDIRLYGLDVAEVVLEKDKVPIDFKVISKGFTGQVPVVVTLLPLDGRGAPRPRRQFITLKNSPEAQNHRVEFEPRQPGKFMLRVEIPAKRGELFADNNFAEKPVTVLSEKIKVLYVEGPPRYEYRFLANAMTRDPTMRTHVLLQSADPHYQNKSSAGLTPLRRFPSTREELFEYHVVMLGDVPPSFFKPEQLEWLVEFVDDIGGGLVFMAGMWNMPNQYRGTPLEKLLPVELEEGASNYYNMGDHQREFYSTLTPEGEQSPLMQFVSDPKLNRSLWERSGSMRVRMPGFYWYQRVKKLKRGAVALAVHESEDHLSYGPRPLFAFQYLGRGRTFISLTDETWRWRRGVGNKYFYRFWGQVIRFTSAGRLLGKKQRFSVATDQREYTLGSPVNLLVRVLDEKFKALKVDEYAVHVLRTDAEEAAEVVVAQTPGRPEFFEGNVEARELGEHQVWIEHREQKVASSTFRVVVPQLEYNEPQMDQPRLERIAKTTGGAYYNAYDIASLPDKLETFEKEIAVPAENRPLWDTQWLLLLFVGLLTLEWILRKLFRLV